MKLKYGKKEKKRVPAPEPVESGWYKEGGLPSAYDKPQTKEKKKYSYIDDDDESSDILAENERYQRRSGKDKVLSAYTEYQESSDLERGKRNQGGMVELQGSVNPNPSPTTAAAPPPLLSQRRNSAPMTSSPTSMSPSYQPKPVQAPPLLSQRSRETPNPLLHSDVEVSDSMKSHRSANQVGAIYFSSPFNSVVDTCRFLPTYRSMASGSW